MLLIPGEKNPLARIWSQAACAALQGGATATCSIEAADDVAMSYDARFGEDDDDKLNASMSLVTALKYYERGALIGLQVLLLGSTDAPAVGKLKDFADLSQTTPASALVVWTTGGPDGEHEAWIDASKLQMILKVNKIPVKPLSSI
jgi:hypothetical protein